MFGSMDNTLSVRTSIERLVNKGSKTWLLDTKSQSMEDLWKDLSADDGLDAILAFRAVVMAIFLWTAADISCVAGTEPGKTVVQFL